MSDNAAEKWPSLPDVEQKDPQIELKKLLYQAQLQEFTANEAEKRELEKDIRTKNNALDQAVYTAYLEVGKSHLDRVQARAEFVEKAAGTIATVYGAVLGFSYSVEKQTLPIRGFVPAFFLGLSIALAAIYLAFLTRPHSDKILLPVSELPTVRTIEAQRDFLDWISENVLNRASWLRLAVISLSLGVLFLPVAFLEIQDNIVLITAGILIVLSTLVTQRTSLVLFFRKLGPSQKRKHGISQKR